MEGWVACLLAAGREREPQTDSLSLLRTLVKICGSKNVSFLSGFNNLFYFCVSWSWHCETPEPHSFAQAEKLQSCGAVEPSASSITLPPTSSPKVTGGQFPHSFLQHCPPSVRSRRLLLK